MSDSDEDGGRWGYRGRSRSRSRSSSRSSRERDSYWYNKDSREGSESPDSRRNDPYSSYFDGGDDDEDDEERKERDGFGFTYNDDDNDKDSDHGGLPHYYSRRSSNSSRNSHMSRRDLYLENEKDEEQYEWNSWRCKKGKDRDSHSSRSSSRSDRFGFRHRGDDSDDDGRSRRKRRRAAEAEDYLESEYGRSNHDRLPICCCSVM